MTKEITSEGGSAAITARGTMKAALWKARFKEDDQELVFAAVRGISTNLVRSSGFLVRFAAWFTLLDPDETPGTKLEEGPGWVLILASTTEGWHIACWSNPFPIECFMFYPNNTLLALLSSISNKSHKHWKQAKRQKKALKMSAELINFCRR